MNATFINVTYKTIILLSAAFQISFYPKGFAPIQHWRYERRGPVLTLPGALVSPRT